MQKIKVGDLIEVTNNAGNEDYYAIGSIGEVVDIDIGGDYLVDYLVDFKGFDNAFVNDLCSYWYVTPSDCHKFSVNNHKNLTQTDLQAMQSLLCKELKIISYIIKSNKVFVNLLYKQCNPDKPTWHFSLLNKYRDNLRADKAKYKELAAIQHKIKYQLGNPDEFN